MRARERWPRINLPLQAFAAHVDRLKVEDHRLDAHGEDLFIAVAVLDGVPHALERLEKEYLSRARAVAARVDREASFVDDVAQELRVKLVCGTAPKLQTFSAGGSLVQWLRVATLRTAINMRRSDRLVAFDKLPVEALVVEPANVPRKEIYARDLQQALEAAFARLDTRSRNLLRLYFIDGLNIERIGAIYGAHRATVARWLAAIRETLLDKASADFAARHRLDTADVQSIYRLLASQLHLTISRVLGAAITDPGAPRPAPTPATEVKAKSARSTRRSRHSDT
jgi:RNA polymerase sigma-70 factor (ECF subfamily)